MRCYSFGHDRKQAFMNLEGYLISTARTHNRHPVTTRRDQGLN